MDEKDIILALNAMFRHIAISIIDVKVESDDNDSVIYCVTFTIDDSKINKFTADAFKSMVKTATLADFVTMERMGIQDTGFTLYGVKIEYEK